jgi:hypothetical protein
MKFVKPAPPLTDQDILNAETTLGIVLPLAVRDLYLSSNGGIPEPYVFENKDLDTVVSEFLPLGENGDTAIQSYRRLVEEKKVVPLHLFPFAVDGGGDYFFVDCSTPEGSVYFYSSDSVNDDHLLSLEIGFEQFWLSLKDETPPAQPMAREKRIFKAIAIINKETGLFGKRVVVEAFDLDEAREITRCSTF